MKNGNAHTTSYYETILPLFRKKIREMKSRCFLIAIIVPLSILIIDLDNHILSSDNSQKQ